MHCLSRLQWSAHNQTFVHVLKASEASLFGCRSTQNPHESVSSFPPLIKLCTSGAVHIFMCYHWVRVLQSVGQSQKDDQIHPNVRSNRVSLCREECYVPHPYLRFMSCMLTIESCAHRSARSICQSCGGRIGSMPLDGHSQEHTGSQMESAL